MVQLKGNLTYADRAHATYWLKAHGFYQPVLVFVGRKTCQN